jgi:hypothetical protein
VSPCEGTAWVVTRYPDGTEVHAHPQHGAEDEARARALGYPDVAAMTLDHDRLHTLLAQALTGGRSPVLWAQAYREVVLDAELADAEEQLVLAAQRFVALAGRR